MRLVIKSGKQKELIRASKHKLTWREFANELGIKKGKLLAYYHEEVLIPKELFLNLSENRRFRNFILEEREERWGQVKGGKANKGEGSTKKIRIPKLSKELAEFYGIMLGDGNVTKMKGEKVGTYSIRIVGDIRKDREYLAEYVKPLIAGLFDINVRESRFKNSNAMYLEAHGKRLVEFLESIELKAGNKIKNRVGIPVWIKKDRSFLTACLAGLYDTDGSAYKLTGQNSYQINFSNRNDRLLNEARSALISLDINPSKVTKGKEFNITKKSELRKFLKKIKLHNSKHLNKIKVWDIAPSYSWSSGIT